MKLHTRVAGKQVSSDTARLKQKKNSYVITKNITIKFPYKSLTQNYLSHLFVTRSHQFVAKKEFLHWIFTFYFLLFQSRFSKNRVTLIELRRKWAIHIIIRLAQTNLFLVSKHVYNTTIAFFFLFARWFN